MKKRVSVLILLLFFVTLNTCRTIASVKTVPANATILKDGFYYHPINKDIEKRIKGKSYKKNNNISLSNVRYIKVKYYDFKGNVQTGELIVNKKIAKDIVEIFYDLYEHKYPIQSMKLIDKYDADDVKSMSANNTSAFNYRTIAGSNTLSNHSYGMAIDINPRINPYITKGGKSVSPANGKIYVERDVKKCKGAYKDYMIHKNDYIYKLFINHGFTWGGDWTSSKDYQHFEKK